MQKPIISHGNPPEKNDIYENLLKFLENVLLKFITNETAEDDITQDLVIFLDEETRKQDTIFSFINQYKEGKYKVDIGVYLRSKAFIFCCIEAKRLPIPNSSKRDPREYVIVEREKYEGNGGIQRFKEGKHAKNLSLSIMLGYIQDGNNSNYWFSKINTWITELISIDKEFWNIDDCLVKYNSNKCDRYFSTHKKRDNTKIILHHFWIKLKNNKGK